MRFCARDWMGGAGLLAFCAFMLGAAAGCGSLMTPDGPEFTTDAGRIEMDVRSRRYLKVADHTTRRDERGRLVTRITFKNTSENEYLASIRVRFIKAGGLMERSSYDSDVHRIPPGLYAVEWTSYSPDALSYVVEVRSSRFFR